VGAGARPPNYTPACPFSEKNSIFISIFIYGSSRCQLLYLYRLYSIVPLWCNWATFTTVLATVQTQCRSLRFYRIYCVYVVLRVFRGMSLRPCLCKLNWATPLPRAKSVRTGWADTYAVDIFLPTPLRLVWRWRHRHHPPQPVVRRMTKSQVAMQLAPDSKTLSCCVIKFSLSFQRRPTTSAAVDDVRTSATSKQPLQMSK